MAAAEARASGIPVVVPDRGGATDFARHGGGLTYRSADRGDVVRAILRLPQGGGHQQPSPPEYSMQFHFNTLFAHYSSLGLGSLQRAA